MKKLNLGCGSDIRQDYINLDFQESPGVDIVHNLNKYPWPFEEDEVDEVVMKNILEHLEDPKKSLLELRRICKPGSKIYIRVPHFSSCNVWGDIEHKRGFNYSTFLNQNLQEYFKVLNQRITFSHFKFYMRPFANRFPLFYEKHFAYSFPAVDLLIELEVKK